VTHLTGIIHELSAVSRKSLPGTNLTAHYPKTLCATAVSTVFVQYAGGFRTADTAVARSWIIRVNAVAERAVLLTAFHRGRLESDLALMSKGDSGRYYGNGAAS